MADRRRGRSNDSCLHARQFLEHAPPRARLADYLRVDYVLNELMRSIYDAAQETAAASSLRPGLQEIKDAGLIRVCGRIYLRYYAEKRQETAAGMSQWTAERWVNDIHIESSRPPTTLPGAPMSGPGSAVHLRRLPGFAALAQQRVQAVAGLPSASANAGQHLHYPVGSLHLYQFARPEDDARAAVEAFAQPVLVVTSGRT